MSGWVKAALIIGLAVIGLVGLNVSLWRRMKQAVAQRRDWTEADFLASLATSGCASHVAAVVLDIVRPYYHADVAPQGGDDLKRFVGVDEDEVEDWTEQAFRALNLQMPSKSDPARVPSIVTVGDWASYLDRRYRAMSRTDA